MCKLQAAEVHMHYEHATSQDIFPPIHGVVLTDYDVNRYYTPRESFAPLTLYSLYLRPSVAPLHTLS